MSEKNFVDGLPVIKQVDDVCESCIAGKHHRGFSKKKGKKSNKTYIIDSYGYLRANDDTFT